VDGSRVRAHLRGAAKKQPPHEAMGKLRSGLRTQIHAAVAALGQSRSALPTPGKPSESTQAEALIDGFAMDDVILNLAASMIWLN
jgi:hypothetical protein